jgi:hypothetical protein
MPIVKYFPEEKNLPANVAREISRYVRHNFVPLEEYEQYRDAAVKIDTKPVKHDYKVLNAFADKLQENAQDEREYDDADDLRWAISNTKVLYRESLREAAHANAGVKWNEERWEKENEDTGTFEASLYWWRKKDAKEQHPAILLTMLLSRYAYSKN